MNPRAGVIDVGSNSIKSLVAEADGTPYGLRTIHEEYAEVRISQGIGGTPPQLQPSRIEAGVAAVSALWRACHAHGPLRDFRIVATSAVRSAVNGDSFLDAVEAATGCRPAILSGGEEADGIALGVRSDPEVGGKLDSFTIFDLGGGSLELIRVEHMGVTARTSLPLGSVRLTERFIRNPALPVPPAEQAALADHVQALIQSTGFPLKRPLVGCGGGLGAVRLVLEGSYSTGETGPSTVFPADRIRELCRKTVSQGVGERIAISGLPANRADIFPAAMLTFQAILDLSGARDILYSRRNLRYGIAWELLSGRGGGA